MGISFTTTQNYGANNGVKILVIGRAARGKTELIRTAEAPMIISAESGLLTLTDVNIPVLEIKNSAEAIEAKNWAMYSEETRFFKWFCLDSISDIADVVLSEKMKLYKDGRQAYGELNEFMGDFIRDFRNLKGKNVYFTAQQARVEDSTTGGVSYVGYMPGKTLLKSLPYFFDEVLYARIGKLPGTEGAPQTYYYLQAEADPQRECKDRSKKLPKICKPDLTFILNKINTPGA
jgi:hypothetical protein